MGQQQDDSVDEGTYHQVQCFEIHLQDPHGRRESRLMNIAPPPPASLHLSVFIAMIIK